MGFGGRKAIRVMLIRLSIEQAKTHDSSISIAITMMMYELFGCWYDQIRSKHFTSIFDFDAEKSKVPRYLSV